MAIDLAKCSNLPIHNIEIIQAIKGICSQDTYTTITNIDKGASVDKKYYLETSEGEKRFLRVANIERLKRKKNEFKAMQKLVKKGVPTLQPLEFGLCNEGVYTFTSWIEGKELKSQMGSLTKSEQYLFGIKAGKILKNIHKISMSKNLEKWDFRFTRKLDRVKHLYKERNIQIKNAALFFAYLEDNMRLLEARPQNFLHGDFGARNMIIDGEYLRIIDFGNYDYGDPWQEFFKVSYTTSSRIFATGQIHGYFDGEPPKEFWPLLAFYFSYHVINTGIWAYGFSENSWKFHKRYSAMMLDWFDDMKTPIPKWYREEEQIKKQLKSEIDSAKQ